MIIAIPITLTYKLARVKKQHKTKQTVKRHSLVTFATSLNTNHRCFGIVDKVVDKLKRNYPTQAPLFGPLLKILRTLNIFTET